MTFSEKLLKLRKREGVSQEELANRLEVSRQAVSRWELGTAMPDAPKLFQLSRIFGVTADYLLDDAQEEFAVQEKTQAPVMMKPKGNLAEKIAGGVIAGLGAVGLLIFGIWSSVSPVYIEAAYELRDGEEILVSPVQQGMAAFLSRYNLGWLFVLCIVCVIVGVGIALLPHVIRNWKNRK